MQEKLRKVFSKWENKIFQEDESQFLIDFIQDNEMKLSGMEEGEITDRELEDFTNSLQYQLNNVIDIANKKTKKKLGKLIVDLCKVTSTE